MSHIIRNIVQLQTSCSDVLLCLSISSSIGLVGPNVAVDTVLNNRVMNQIGVTEERKTRNVITTCAAGAKRGAVIALKEIDEELETVQR